LFEINNGIETFLMAIIETNATARIYILTMEKIYKVKAYSKKELAAIYK
jgi:hypothetical protein